MPSWKDISDSEEKKRAAAFEAQMLAMLAKEKPAAPVPPPPVAPARNGIQITVTANGQTARYDNLDTVPLPVRQQILNAWQPAVPPMPSPPVLEYNRDWSGLKPPPTKSRRAAMVLNLIWPGAGQIYLGQSKTGSLYALGFAACFVTMIVIFLRDYSGYLEMSTGGDILETGNLEKLAQSFHTGVLGMLQVAALVIYLVSAIHLSRTKP